jgi:Ala-tRNA(Pro) deacylase
MHETYDKLIALLDANKASYRLIDHAAEGQTDKVSALRGHPVEAAAKCIVLIVKIGKKTSRFVLAVIPGNTHVDTGKIKSLFSDATYAGFAATDVAERLAGSVVGTILPFTFRPELVLIADPSITQHQELFFNADQWPCEPWTTWPWQGHGLSELRWLEPLHRQHLALVRFQEVHV